MEKRNLVALVMSGLLATTSAFAQQDESAVAEESSKVSVATAAAVGVSALVILSAGGSDMKLTAPDSGSQPPSNGGTDSGTDGGTDGTDSTGSTGSTSST